VVEAGKIRSTMRESCDRAKSRAGPKRAVY